MWPGARYGLGLISTPLSCGGMWWAHAGGVPGDHGSLIAVGSGGRSAAIALNELPASHQVEHLVNVVDKSFCEARSSGIDDSAIVSTVRLCPLITG
ncbi:hypothetical protein ADL12_03590 [Streptomyces regalis]|uniref:Uncharacterized protein n=1 Tax=Streptomyces regalis TaxID=68262 RepID=A0A0X3VKX5_9ACTN|nr:hypothetical protein ADL12_03590 [Streptomyces regalis]